MKKLALILSVSIVFLSLIGGSVFAMTEEQGQEIVDIEVTGNINISKEVIMEQISTQPGDIVNQNNLREDMQSIYDLGYFQDVMINPESYERGIRLIFRIYENPLLEDINFDGNEVFSDEKLMEWLGLEKNEVLNTVKMNQGLENIMNMYEEKGYSLASIRDVGHTNGVLHIEVSPGKLNTINLEGNEKTRDFVIFRNLEIEEDGIFSVDDLQDSYQNLSRLQYFEEITPEFSPAVDGDGVDLTLNVKETTTGEFGLSGGYQHHTDDGGGWIGQIYVEEKNLLGRGQELSFNWDFGSVTNYSLSFREPWLFGTEASFGTSVYDRTRDSQRDGIEYEEHRRGGNLSLGHPITDEWDGNIRFKIENTTTDWEDDVRDFDRTRSITLTGDRDTTNHYLSPTSGGRDTLSVEYAGPVLGGDQDFTKYNLHIRRFFPGFTEDHAWALRTKIGAGDGDIPNPERYRIGGAETLRGYDRFSFDGKKKVLLGAEYRFPIVDMVNGVIFTDAGNAWDSKRDIDLGDLHKSVGAGVRLNTPLGMLRLDYGFNENQEGNFHFSLGETF